MKPNQKTFFFYDLETSGLNPRQHRIMQFAGQRTDINLKPIGDPINMLVRLSDDVLPDPYAVMVTGITPQKTVQEGYSEAEFLKILHQQVFMPGTILVGYNNVRFDDEFMRHTMYRNFYDPYEWAWQQERSRWDLLDVVRMTRALRPNGLKWPIVNGKPTNKLELLSKINDIEHSNAHDAMSDVLALIGVARLIKKTQPKLFDYMLNLRNKHKISELVSADNPRAFVYTSGRYGSDNLHTTVAVPLTAGDKPGTVLVWDLRHNPANWANKKADELKNARFATREQRQDPNFVSLPAKELNITRCPAVAPLAVLDTATKERLNLNIDEINKHIAALNENSVLTDQVREVFASNTWPKGGDVDERLYEGFVNDRDKARLMAVREASSEKLADLHPEFNDERLGELLLRYKARNFPSSLSGDEKLAWESYRKARIAKDLPGFMKQLSAVAAQNDFLAEELKLWAESIVPLG